MRGKAPPRFEGAKPRSQARGAWSLVRVSDGRVLAFAPDAITLRMTARKLFPGARIDGAIDGEEWKIFDRVPDSPRFRMGSGVNVVIAKIVRTRTLARAAYYEAPVMKPVAGATAGA